MLCNLASSVSDLRSDQIPLKVPFSPELPCSAVDTCIDVSDKRVMFQDSEDANRGEQTANVLLAARAVAPFFPSKLCFRQCPKQKCPFVSQAVLLFASSQER